MSVHTAVKVNVFKTTCAASFYPKFKFSSGKSKIALIYSKDHTISVKTRKSNNIPRNELHGMLLSTRLTNSLRKALLKVYDICLVTYWTDSSIACAWVQNENKVQDKYILQSRQGVGNNRRSKKTI